MSEMVYSRADMTWLPREEYEARKAEREERAFWRNRRNQGELCAPMVIRDGMPAVQSQATGRVYDSKSAIRKEYRALGMVEVGNDSSLTGGRRKAEPSYYERQAQRQGVRAALERAGSVVDTMSDESIKARQWERDARSAALTGHLD